jgi:hypothetical protein
MWMDTAVGGSGARSEPCQVGRSHANEQHSIAIAGREHATHDVYSVDLGSEDERVVRRVLAGDKVYQR